MPIIGVPVEWPLEMGSEGDIRVVLAMNAILSFLFSWGVVSGLAFIGVLSFDWRTVGYATAFLFAFSYLVAIR